MILTLMVTSRHLSGFDASRFQQQIGERLDQTFGIGAQRVLGNPKTQIQTQLHRLAILAFSPHVLSPSSKKDGIVRPTPESRPEASEQQQIRSAPQY
ncbi:hypothetical protein HAP47_0041245 (plasmid) [Bradyrhizobium sp. 41S5]|nr:hypothetical protein [Bradyrhizobium sp. 41S5]UFX44253.1 hypothetical protein HAP47_0034940 [Bradyrhizobium sp. 41S5]UFX44260.1 hypothetical protein HAP47_0034990 [Bradyrhizobium sp. 41S5]UFX44268.1 hypothetical protein HAP47_0035060 [Bradyrhizobium sp. 41S5]UFX44286.1 hypothetical protein HAP47_0035250 [Bradyrhizobium sp. 41S5]UFX44416.1 hypothetical protein HAP47_0036305 [Bradyrhizobium sp. 41S5]